MRQQKFEFLKASIFAKFFFYTIVELKKKYDNQCSQSSIKTFEKTNVHSQDFSTILINFLCEFPCLRFNEI